MLPGAALKDVFQPSFFATEIIRLQHYQFKLHRRKIGVGEIERHRRRRIGLRQLVHAGRAQNRTERCHVPKAGDFHLRPGRKPLRLAVINQRAGTVVAQVKSLRIRLRHHAANPDVILRTKSAGQNLRDFDQRIRLVAGRRQRGNDGRK